MEELLLRIGEEGEAKRVWKTEVYFESEEERDEFELKLKTGWTPLQWVEAALELPAIEGQQVLCVVEDRWQNIVFRHALMLGEYSLGEGWVLDGYPQIMNPNVTHWMYLPEGPEVE